MNLADSQDALRDAILIRAGVHKINSPLVHPQARHYVEKNENVLKSLVTSFAIAQGAGRSSSGSAMAFGLSSSDFANALSSSMTAVAVQRLAAHTAHRSFVPCLNGLTSNPPIFQTQILTSDLMKLMNLVNSTET